METNPILQFKDWLGEQLKQTAVKLPYACCLSTVDTDHYPNARFVSLKEVTDAGFIITGSITARKGMEINSNNKVALTFWWAETERQVRIQGEADQISNQLADAYFANRNRDSQIVSAVSVQGAELTDPGQLQEAYDLLESKDQPITRPENWGGYLIVPQRIEFLAFKATRFHDRTLFEKINQKWVSKKLQP